MTEDSTSSNNVIAYDYDFLPPLAMAKKVPLPHYTLHWAILVGCQVLRILLNGLANRFEGSFQKLVDRLDKINSDVTKDSCLAASVELALLLDEISHSVDDRPQLKADLEALKKVIKHPDKVVTGVKQLLYNALPTGRATSLEEFNKMFKVIPLPAIATTFQEDASFADMRVAGPNPLVIERMAAPIAKFPLSNSQYQAVMGADDSLDKAFAQSRIFIVDFVILQGAVQGSHPSEQKYLEAPMAMYALPSGDCPTRKLVPLAVQCGQDPSQYPIITPPAANDESGAANWAMAKTVVQVCDGNFHEAVSHLGRTHLVVEPFVIATANCLDEVHPISKLLTPHYEGTLFINNMAQASLIASGGTVDQIMGATIDQSRLLAVIGCQSYLIDFNNSFLKLTLKARGVEDPKVLPYYPFRDHALPVWDAIESWVADYLAIYYPDDAAVLADQALQSWLGQLMAHDGGRLKNVGEEGKLASIAYLTQMLTMVIFTASAGHAAVNFPQSTIMSYTPAMPLAGYRPAPNNGPASHQDWLSSLPNLTATSSQLNLGTALGSVYYTRLGAYPPNQFDSAQVKADLAKFQAKLAQIEAQMVADGSAETYPYLLPSQIPQSINI